MPPPIPQDKVLVTMTKEQHDGFLHWWEAKQARTARKEQERRDLAEAQQRRDEAAKKAKEEQEAQQKRDLEEAKKAKEEQEGQQTKSSL